MQMEFGTIIQIGDVLVSEEVVTEYFSCDYSACRGACCIVGDGGAPLEEAEVEYLERDYPVFQNLMSSKGREAAELTGFFEIDRDGDMVTPLVEGTCECAFCHFGSTGEALCAIEKAGCTKPLSCALYPIRVSKFSGGLQALNLHRWDICRPAFKKGRESGVLVYQFLHKSLIKAYGEDFYLALDEAAKHLLR